MWGDWSLHYDAYMYLKPGQGVPYGSYHNPFSSQMTPQLGWFCTFIILECVCQKGCLRFFECPWVLINTLCSRALLNQHCIVHWEEEPLPKCFSMGVCVHEYHNNYGSNKNTNNVKTEGKPPITIVTAMGVNINSFTTGKTQHNS